MSHPVDSINANSMPIAEEAELILCSLAVNVDRMVRHSSQVQYGPISALMLLAGEKNDIQP